MLRNYLFTRLTKRLINHKQDILRLKPISNYNHVVKMHLSDRGESEEDIKRANLFGVLNERVLKKIGDKKGDIREQNGFQLFDLEQKFNINMAKLQNEMHKLQKIVHPDKFVNRKKESQDLSDYLSALINDYYRVLSHPYERAKYLLSLISNNPDVEKSLDNLKMDPEFLSRMMDIQGKVESSQQDLYELEKMAIILNDELEQLVVELDRDFSEKNIDSILKKLGKLKFLANCHQRLTERTGSFSRF